MARRSHSHSKKRRRNRGRFGPLFKLLCLLAIVVALTAGATVFFRAETIVVTGNERYTQEEIITASGIQKGDNLYKLNKLRINENIRTTLPYVGDLIIRRSLPSTIVITVTEWSAAAQIAVPDPAAAAEAQKESSTEAQDDEQGDSAGGSTQAGTSPVAQEPWLINVKGKLLEPAPENSGVLEVSGITPLMPKAGTQLSVPQSEQMKLDALLALLGAIEEAQLGGQISFVRLENTQLIMGYAGRFDVKMELNDDFSYNLQVIQEVREKIEQRHGIEAGGTLDLTREEGVLYSPA